MLFAGCSFSLGTIHTKESGLAGKWHHHLWLGMREMDGDGSGEVSFVEFYRWWDSSNTRCCDRSASSPP